MSEHSTLRLEEIARFAAEFDAAHSKGSTLDLPTKKFPDLNIEDAYLIQNAVAARWKSRGRKQAGYKAGLTSRAKMEQMNVGKPTFGVLMKDMCIPDGGGCEIDRLSRPRVEPEIAFVLKEDVADHFPNEQEVIDAVDYVVPAIEIIDSRFRDYKLDLPSAIADNSSSAKYVIGGRPMRADEIDLRTLGIVMLKNGTQVGVTAGAAVLGNPLRTVMLLSQWLAESGEHLPGGSLILTGGASEAVPVSSGDVVCARFQDLGDVLVRFAGKGEE
ncbi:2-keto-4-pentenoate hydratase [Hyphococcus sp.]|uniref:2-keto-4-pentenoate hydratase n=1 Tax=Hyphococcus sp. TaxID=2038636 RepID=UPI0035C703A0